MTVCLEHFLVLLTSMHLYKKFAPFMNREFQKEIYNRSKLRNKYWKQPNEEHKIAYKKQRNTLRLNACLQG